MNAAAVWPGGQKAYFFRGSEYVLYDIAADKVAANYPRPIKGNWSGLPWDSGIDAVVVWPGNQFAYFFRGSEYVRYNIATDKADAGYPQPITNFWKGLWADGIDAALPWIDDKKVYFFRDDEYVLYDIEADQVAPGYPQLIADHWSGLSTWVSAPSDLCTQLDDKIKALNAEITDLQADVDDPGHKGDGTANRIKQLEKERDADLAQFKNLGCAV